MKLKYLFLVGLLLASCTGGFAQKKVVSIWLPEDEDGILSQGRKMQMSAKLRQDINETMYGFQAVMRQGTLKDKELGYTQGGNTEGESRSGMERLGDYYLSSHVYAVGDDVVYLMVDILTPKEEVLITADQDDVPKENIVAAFSNLGMEALNRLRKKIGTEAIVDGYIEIPKMRLQVRTVDDGAGDWETANRICREINNNGDGWRLPTAAEMSQILQEPDAPTKLHITLNATYWTSTDGDRPNFKIAVKATRARAAIDEGDDGVDNRSAKTYENTINEVRQYKAVPTSSYTGSGYQVRAVRKY